MNGYLLDTSVALLAGFRSASLSRKVRAAIERGPVFLSAVSFWEVVLKSMKGKLDVGDPRSWWTDLLAQLAAIPMPLRPEHVAETLSLPPIHGDPFDRALIAQAMAEGLDLVTVDREIVKYACKRLRVVC